MNSGSPSRILQIHSVEWICRWCTLHNIARFDSFVSPPYSHGTCGALAPRRPAGHSRGARSRGPGRPPPGAARREWSGSPGRRRAAGPVPFITIGTTAASQHSIRSDSGETGPPKSRHPARARFCRSSSRISTLTCGRCPPVCGTIDEGAWSSTYPHTSASASACRSPGAAVVVGGQRLGLGVDHGGDRVEHRRVVEPALELATPVAAAGQEQLVHPRRRPVVGLLAVLVQQRRPALVPQCVQLVGVYSVGLRGELLLRTRPLLGGQPARPPCSPAPGRSPRRAADSSAPSPNTCRRRRQPRRGAASRRAPVRGATCSAATTRRRASNRSQPSRSLNACAGGLVTSLGEHPVAVQPGDRGHRDLVQLPRRRLTQRQHRHPLAAAPASATPAAHRPPARTGAARQRAGSRSRTTFSRPPPTIPELPPPSRQRFLEKFGRLHHWRRVELDKPTMHAFTHRTHRPPNRRGWRPSPGHHAGVVEEPAGRAVVGQGREPDRDRRALFGGADAAEAVEVGRDVAGAGRR